MVTQSNIEKLCFVLMPFSKEFKNQWELAFKPAIEEAGMSPWRGDDKALGTNIIIRDVTRCISEAVLIIADLTGKNPNVMYELGLAHAAKKPVIMLTQNEEDIPFDIKHIRYLKYDYRDLSGLKNALLERISHTVAMGAKNQPDFFPELKIFQENNLRELNYLRENVFNIEITTSPPIADLFFNDKYIGYGPQTIKVNPDAARNSLSAAFPLYFEFHRELTEEDFRTRKVSINLELRKNEELSKRVPRWLRYRRLYPDNPVLTHAIIYYLETMEEYKEEEAELKILLSIAPGWYLSHNAFASYMVRINKLNESIIHYQRAVSLRPDHYIGNYNLACVYSLQNQYEKCISKLRQILESEDMCKSFTCVPYRSIDEDPDFDSIKKDHEYAAEFDKIAVQFKDLYNDLNCTCGSTG